MAANKKQVGVYLNRADVCLLGREAARRRMTLADLVRTLFEPLLERLRREDAGRVASEAIADAKRLPDLPA